jgi:hypothetical protein
VLVIPLSLDSILCQGKGEYNLTPYFFTTTTKTTITTTTTITITTVLLSIRSSTMQEKLKLSSDGGDSGRNKYKRNYAGAYEYDFKITLVYKNVLYILHFQYCLQR